MRKNPGEHIQFTAGTRGHGYVIHLTVRFEFSKDTFLGSTALVECNDPAWATALIGHDDFEFVSVLCGLEQIELHWRFVLAPDLLTDEAVGWISSRGKSPFFLYVPYTAVHLPIKERPHAGFEQEVEPVAA